MTTTHTLEENGYRSVTYQPRPIQFIITSTSCWECVSHKKDKYGYTVVNRWDSKIKLHRYSYMLHTKESLTKEDIIRHTCDNPACLNPSHLIKGTVQDNNQDMVDRDRYRKGNKHILATLTEEKYFEIMKEISLGRSGVDIESITGVSRDIVYKIKKGTHWSCKEFTK